MLSRIHCRIIHFQALHFASISASAVRARRKIFRTRHSDFRRYSVTCAGTALIVCLANHLRTIAEELSRPEAHDPKVGAVRYFLTENRSEGKTWLEHGCIVFSQYYDTSYSLGAQLAMSLPGEPLGVYAGAGKSGLFRGKDF